MEMEIEHPSHEHSLILNENYIAREGDVCRACNEKIVSCKSSIYSCSRNSITDDISDDLRWDSDDLIWRFFRQTRAKSCAQFLLHKSCAELPAFIPNPTNPKDFLKLCFKGILFNRCNVCCIAIQGKQFLYFSSDTDIYICFKCALFHFHRSLEDRKFEHPAHSQHPLALIQRPSSFKCDACKVDDNKDSSYRCTKCQFWMHKCCADAPTTFQFQFHHQHPLVLLFSLPQVYYNFLQHCRLCKETLNRLDWIYYCRYCRYFTHFQCARSSQMLSILSSSENEKDDSDVVHLPAADESSMNLLGEEFVKGMSTLYNTDNNISCSTKSIKHWTHDEHHLQLMTISELNYQKDYDEILLKCDGCGKPIQTNDDHPFYGCVPCKYFLHTFCAELPRKIEHYSFPDDITISSFKYKETYKILPCVGCRVSYNGIFFHNSPFIFLDIGCATLPKMIKHEAHGHKLNQVLKPSQRCQACGKTSSYVCYHRCEQCDYSLCNGCIMKSKTINHPWDPHPLHLIYDPAMVTDHVHDFNCEFCSKDIDANFWFYHCTDCDLSLHLDTCFQRSRYREYSNIKFGATDIVIRKLHPHSLTFVLNRKVRYCQNCGTKQLGEPIFECNAPCKVIFCTDCTESRLVYLPVIKGKQGFFGRSPILVSSLTTRMLNNLN
ncbi:uncharacterized protein LOC141686928 [Apium graveolens]|uniref:uncharacterized protein LOC141686928 n=1 Tax=Apium graveolens TaxID=4045 RepID=UPI003D79EDD7